MKPASCKSRNRESLDAGLLRHLFRPLLGPLDQVGLGGAIVMRLVLHPLFLPVQSVDVVGERVERAHVVSALSGWVRGVCYGAFEDLGAASRLARGLSDLGRGPLGSYTLVQDRCRTQRRLLRFFLQLFVFSRVTFPLLRARSLHVRVHMCAFVCVY